MKHYWPVRSVWVVLSIIGCSAALFLFYTRQKKADPPIVWYTARGFSPRTVTVPVGTTVTFRSAGPAFWPASNFHPLHVIYPQFDAKTIITSGESYSFTFARVGKWRFHNHLRAADIGTVVVTDEHGGTVNPDCAHAEMLAADMTLALSCWAAEIETVLSQKGFDAAFARFDELYSRDAVFVANCHDMTHLIGEAAYRQFVETGKGITSDKTALCGYGFFHGFIETMLQTQESYDTAVRFCAEIQAELSKTIASPNAIYACYHGIGHGTFDALPQRIWGNDREMVRQALATCREVTVGKDEILYKQCATGVFNSLANAYSVQLYTLQYDTQDPDKICREQENEMLQRACYAEVMLGYLRVYFPTLSPDELIQKVTALTHPVGGPMTMFTLVATSMNTDVQSMDFTAWKQRCLSVPENFRSACVEGVAEGLIGWGKPGSEYIQALQWCSTVAKTTQRAVCYEYVLPRLDTLYSREKTAEICSTVPEDVRLLCAR